MNSTIRRIQYAGLALIGAISMSAYAETFALLVGVSGYPSLRPDLQLKGSANDVRLMRDRLVGLGIPTKHIRILADGVHHSNAPTRDNILHAMKNLTQEAKAKDWVVIYWAGHGSVQPGKESNGFDEILLPHDIGKWDGEVGSIKNSILDDEIGAILDKLANNGVYAWVIFDTCYAGGMSRADVTCSPAGCPIERGVEPRQLGVPRELINAMKKRGAAETPRKAPAPPQLNQIHFFAVQPHQTTIEKPIEGDNRYYGVFTYHLANAMINWNGDFSKLMKDIRNHYPAHSMVEPVFQGRTPPFPIK